MAGVIGSLDKFEIGGAEPFEVYNERVGLFCVANGINDADKKKAVFLSSIGVETYKLVRNLCTPGNPTDKTLDDLVKLLKEHVAPAPNVILERFKFNSRNRKEGESVADYIAELRNLARDCGYAANLEEMLRDRIVCGIKDNGMQKKMLSEKDLTFERAQAVALSNEAAAKQAREICPISKEEVAPVHRLDVNSGKKSVICFRCGDTRHPESGCLYRDKRCYICNENGHIARMCTKKQTNLGNKGNANQYSGNRGGGPQNQQQRKSGGWWKKTHNTRNLEHDEGNEGAGSNSQRVENEDSHLYNIYRVGVDDYPIHRCEIRREEPMYRCGSGR